MEPSDLKPYDVKAYMGREWSLVRETKGRYWAERKPDLTPEEALGIAEGLRRQVLSLRPDWPDERERDLDLETHARVAESLRRVGSAASR